MFIESSFTCDELFERTVLEWPPLMTPGSETPAVSPTAVVGLSSGEADAGAEAKSIPGDAWEDRGATDPEPRSSRYYGRGPLVALGTAVTVALSGGYAGHAFGWKLPPELRSGSALAVIASIRSWTVSRLGDDAFAERAPYDATRSLLGAGQARRARDPAQERPTTPVPPVQEPPVQKVPAEEPPVQRTPAQEPPASLPPPMDEPPASTLPTEPPASLSEAASTCGAAAQPRLSVSEVAREAAEHAPRFERERPAPPWRGVVWSPAERRLISVSEVRTVPASSLAAQSVGRP